MMLIFVAWFATTAMMAMVPRGWPVAASLTLLVVRRAAQGAVQAPVFPVTAGGSLFAWIPPKTWTLANGLSNAGTTVGVQRWLGILALHGSGAAGSDAGCRVRR